MTSYYNNNDLKYYNDQNVVYQEIHSEWNDTIDVLQSNYEQQHATWQEWYDGSVAEMEAYEQAHAAWVENPNDINGNPLPEPQPPIPLPEPKPPEFPPEPLPPISPQIYDSREVTTIEVIQTPTGEALITPGRMVLTGSDNVNFALSKEELESQYTLVEAEPK